MQLKAARLFKYVWPFGGRQALIITKGTIILGNLTVLWCFQDVWKCNTRNKWTETHFKYAVKAHLVHLFVFISYISQLSILYIINSGFEILLIRDYLQVTSNYSAITKDASKLSCPEKKSLWTFFSHSAISVSPFSAQWKIEETLISIMLKSR